MKLNEEKEFDVLKEYGFVKDYYLKNIAISVDKHGRVGIGPHLHWMSPDSYYSDNVDVLVDLIKDGVFVKGVE